MSKPKHKHTPGPWSIGVHSPCGQVNDFYDITAGNTTTKVVDGYIYSRANAALIAASPEMLSQLKDASDAIKDFMRNDSRGVDHDIADAYELLEEMSKEFDIAINKTKGDQS